MADIYQALQHDHDEVRELLDAITRNNNREENFKKLAVEVIKHSFAEERVFYRKLRDLADNIDIAGVNEGLIEHHMVNNLLQLVQEKDKNKAEWEALFFLLRKYLESHMEIEELHMFKYAKEFITEKDASTLASSLKKEKEMIEQRLNIISKTKALHELSADIIEMIMETHEQIIEEEEQ